MKAYVITSGVVFGLLVVAHIWRVFEEGSAVTKNPFFIASTLLAAALFIWACRTLRTMSRS